MTAEPDTSLPWIVVDFSNRFEVRDSVGKHIASVYFDDDGLREAFRRLSKEEARRLANEIANHPDLPAESERDHAERRA
jgi:hypothetical protein